MKLREYAAQLAQDAPQTQAQEKRRTGQQESTGAADIYKRQQEAIKRTELIQTDILKGIRKGESMTALFLKAAEGLALATGNSVFYTQAAADVKAIYGHALADPGAREIEAAEIRQRLQKLETAEREASGSDKERIKAAIQRHRELLQELTAQK